MTNALEKAVEIHSDLKKFEKPLAAMGLKINVVKMRETTAPKRKRKAAPKKKAGAAKKKTGRKKKTTKRKRSTQAEYEF